MKEEIRQLQRSNNDKINLLGDIKEFHIQNHNLKKRLQGAELDIASKDAELVKLSEKDNHIDKSNKEENELKEENVQLKQTLVSL